MDWFSALCGIVVMFSIGWIIYLQLSPTQPAKCIQILVLGDIGRSPRMQYHALSIANTIDCDVELIGYGGTAPHPLLLAHPRIRIYTMPHVNPQSIMWVQQYIKNPRIFHYIYLGYKAIRQTIDLIECLHHNRPRAIIVQTPPAIPLLLVARLMSWIQRAPLIVDWHNLAFSIMRMTSGRNRPALVNVAKQIERVCGMLANDGFCVTQAMQRFLHEKWSIPTTVVYDQPPDIFRSSIDVSLETKHDLFVRLEHNNSFRKLTQSQWYQGLMPSSSSPSSASSPTESKQLQPSLLCTPSVAVSPAQSTDRSASSSQSPPPRPSIQLNLKDNRPFVVVSTTSWTEDEDFSILLNALILFEAKMSQIDRYQAAHGDHLPGTLLSLPKVLVVITGKGDQQKYYHHIIDYLNNEPDSILRVFVKKHYPSEAEYKAPVIPRIPGNETEHNIYNIDRIFTTTSSDVKDTHQQQHHHHRLVPLFPIEQSEHAELAHMLQLTPSQLNEFLHIFHKVQVPSILLPTSPPSSPSSAAAGVYTTPFSHTRITTVWLEAEDYPRLLATSDVGISLHTSSSGLDLPMKIVDMFGSALPVIAKDFSCLDELVTPENGVKFKLPNHLYKILSLLYLVDANPHLYGGSDATRSSPRSTSSLASDNQCDVIDEDIELQPQNALPTLTNAALHTIIPYTIRQMRNHLHQTRHQRNWHHNWMLNVLPKLYKWTKFPLLSGTLVPVPPEGQ